LKLLVSTLSPVEPDETVEAIFVQAAEANRVILLRVCLLSKRYHRIATPLIWQHVSVDLDATATRSWGKYGEQRYKAEYRRGAKMTSRWIKAEPGVLTLQRLSAAVLKDPSMIRHARQFDLSVRNEHRDPQQLNGSKLLNIFSHLGNLRRLTVHHSTTFAEFLRRAPPFFPLLIDATLIDFPMHEVVRFLHHAPALLCFEVDGASNPCAVALPDWPKSIAIEVLYSKVWTERLLWAQLVPALTETVLELCVDGSNRELLDVLPGQVSHLILCNNFAWPSVSLNGELADAARLQNLSSLQVEWIHEPPDFHLLGSFPALKSLSIQFRDQYNRLADLTRVLSDSANLASLQSLSVKACVLRPFHPFSAIPADQITVLRAACEARSLAFTFEHWDCAPLAVCFTPVAVRFVHAVSTSLDVDRFTPS
jgi:hypothetical protein